jgi:hypothetical protein
MLSATELTDKKDTELLAVIFQKGSLDHVVCNLEAT